MIVYFDTSALVPLLIDEPASPACGELWDGADGVMAIRLAYVEAVAALAMAQRMGRVTEAQVRGGRSALEELWSAVDVIEFDPGIMAAAAAFALTHGLRGYDATHCAAAAAVNEAELVAAAGDAALLAAWRAEGIAVRDTNA